MALQSTKNGTGASAQCMPLLAGGPGKTAGAVNIDVSGAGFITFFTACVIYLNAETTKTMTIAVTGGPVMFAIRTISTIHVDGVVEYALA